MAQGPAGNRFGRRLRELRQTAGLDQPGLAAKLKELGHPLPVSSISRLENGERRADISDVVALAVALDVSLPRLVLPDRETAAPVELTEGRSAPWARAWMWACGERSLDQPLSQGETGRQLVGDYLAAAQWRLLNRPHDRDTAPPGLPPAEYADLMERLSDVVTAVYAAADEGVPVESIASFVQYLVVDLGSRRRADDAG